MTLEINEDRECVTLGDESLKCNIAQSFYDFFDLIEETSNQTSKREDHIEAGQLLSHKFAPHNIDKLLANAHTKGCTEKLLGEMIGYIISEEIKKAQL